MSRAGTLLPAVVVAVAVILIALLGIGILANLERVEQVVSSPGTGEARTNPLLAAERLLTRMGLEADSVRRLDELPPVDHVIVLAGQRRVLTQARATRLLEWAGRGGYLIVGPHLRNGQVTDDTSNDPLLEELGVIVEDYEVDSPERLREVVELQDPAGDAMLDVEFFAEYGLALLSEEPEEAGSYALVWSHHGDGLVAVLNDLEFMHSAEIGKHDHARFLWGLIDGIEGRRRVLLVYGWETTSIWVLLLRHAWPALLVGSLFLVAWVWRSARRFGPPIPAPAGGSRELTEHVDALGYFLWRSGRADTLVESARRTLERQMLSRRPDFSSLSRRQQIQELTRRSQIDERTVEAAVFADDVRKREGFTRTMRALEQLRRAL